MESISYLLNLFLYEESALYQVTIGLTSVFVVWITWYLFYRPFNLFMDLTELGFDSATSKFNGGNNSYKRAVINELRQRRKIGELPPPFPNGWFGVLESEELPLKKVREVFALGQNMVAWRGETGKCFVADAYCPHLGAHLGVGGKVVGKDCIQCPFHSWSFNGHTGNLENIPYSESRISARLKMWPVAEHNGFIYIWHHADGLPPSWSLPSCPEIESGYWRYRGRSELRVACHIQEIPENGADVAHLKAVHSTPAIRHGMNLKKDWTIMKHIWGASWAVNDEPGKEHVAVSTVEHHFAFFNDSFRMFSLIVPAQQIGPGIVHLHFKTPFGRGLLVQNVTPLEPLLQRVTHRFYSAPTLIHPWGLAILYTEAIQITRDIRIWNRKCFLKRPTLVKEDSLINKYRRWYSQFYSEGSNGIKTENGNGHCNTELYRNGGAKQDLEF